MKRLAALLLVALLTAGCSGGKAKDDTAKPGDGTAQAELPMLHGFVFDQAIRPLEGVVVKVLDNNATMATDKDGYFGFEALPTERFLVIVATKAGFVPQSKQITLSPGVPVRLNFTLAPVPVAVPYMSTDKSELLVECQVGIVVTDTNQTHNCGTGTQDIDHWDIAVGADLAGAVIEVFWEPTTDAAASVGARLETLELGQLNLILGETVGESPLRIMVPQTTAHRYYQSGGLMRLTVFAAPNADETEAGVGATVLLEQPLTAYSSLFYVAPPDPSYTISNAA